MRKLSEKFLYLKLIPKLPRQSAFGLPIGTEVTSGVGKPLASNCRFPFVSLIQGMEYNSPSAYPSTALDDMPAVPPRLIEPAPFRSITLLRFCVQFIMALISQSFFL